MIYIYITCIGCAYIQPNTIGTGADTGAVSITSVTGPGTGQSLRPWKTGVAVKLMNVNTPVVADTVAGIANINQIAGCVQTGTKVTYAISCTSTNICHLSECIAICDVRNKGNNIARA